MSFDRHTINHLCGLGKISDGGYVQNIEDKT